VRSKVVVNAVDISDSNLSLCVPASEISVIRRFQVDWGAIFFLGVNTTLIGVVDSQAHKATRSIVHQHGSVVVA
jgi:hypothetical protein